MIFGIVYFYMEQIMVVEIMMWKTQQVSFLEQNFESCLCKHKCIAECIAAKVMCCSREASEIQMVVQRIRDAY